MKNDAEKPTWMMKWGLPASLLLHLLGIAVLVLGLPALTPPPAKEEAVKVDLVAPPKPAEKTPADKKPFEKPKTQPPAKAPPPEPKKAAKPVPPTPKKPLRPSTIPVLKKAFQFGEKDAGPRKSAEGSAVKDNAPAPQPKPKPQTLPEPKKTPAPPTISALSARGQVPPSDKQMKPKTPKPADSPAARNEPKLHEVKKLFSQSESGGPEATTAMAGVPRDKRVGRLCATELGEQLMHAASPYFADLLPVGRLEKGTVLDVPRSAFHTGDRWYALSYRCEVDPDATRVVSFAFHVGGDIPRNEWRALGLPSR